MTFTKAQLDAEKTRILNAVIEDLEEDAAVSDVFDPAYVWLESEGRVLFYHVSEELAPLVAEALRKLIPVQPLATEDGWYEANGFPLSEGNHPYRFTDGKWYSVNGNELNENYVRSYAPMRKLVAQR